MKPTFITTNNHKIHRMMSQIRIFPVLTPLSKKPTAMAWKVSINSIAFLYESPHLKDLCNFAKHKDMGKDFVDRQVIETRFRCKSGQQKRWKLFDDFIFSTVLAQFIHISSPHLRQHVSRSGVIAHTLCKSGVSVCVWYGQLITFMYRISYVGSHNYCCSRFIVVVHQQIQETSIGMKE